MRHLNTSTDFEGVAIGTLALGDQFVMHAILLANDLLTYHPNNKFYVLTDKPEVFARLKNVVAVPHKFSGVRRCYNDKRFVAEKMLQVSECCIFLDADSRLLGQIDFLELLATNAFITCLHSKKLQEKLFLEIKKSEKKASSRLKILRGLAVKLKIDFAKVIFVQEPLLVFQRNYGDADKFFSTWNFCAAFTSMRFFEFSEGSSIGISAEMVGARINTLGKNPHWLFKDQLEDYTYKNIDEISMSRQLIGTRSAIEANYKSQDIFVLKIPSYVFRYCKNIWLYIVYKKKLQQISS